MIKRLIDIARANLHGFIGKKTEAKTVDFQDETPFDSTAREEFHSPQDPLAPYYAHLEIPPGSSREVVKSAWKRMLKKYHPDLHDADPGKRKIAGELTRRLTESYRILDAKLSKRG